MFEERKKSSRKWTRQQREIRPETMVEVLKNTFFATVASKDKNSKELLYFVGFFTTEFSKLSIKNLVMIRSDSIEIIF